MLVCFVQELWDSYCFPVSCESLYLVLGCFVQESFDLVIVGFAGYAVLLIVLCFEACLYICITGTGVWFIRRSVLCAHVAFVWVSLLKVGSGLIISSKSNSFRPLLRRLTWLSL